jgi:hypothetical protein
MRRRVVAAAVAVVTVLGAGGCWPRFLTENHRLAAYDVGGCGDILCEPSWAFDLPAGDTYAPPVVGGNLVFVSDIGSSSQVYAVAVAYADGVVYVVDGAALRAFDADGYGAPTCYPLWVAPRSTPPDGESPNRIAVAGGVVYVGTSSGGDGVLRAFALDGCGAPSCGELWSTGVDGTPQAMSVAAGRLLVTVERGTAYTGAPNSVLAFAPSG